MKNLFKITVTAAIVAAGSIAFGNVASASMDMKSKMPPGEMSGQAMKMERGFLLPYIDPARGRKLFASKGCVVCHSVNGIGGEDAPPLTANEMLPVMNPFEFAARMWRGASTMIAMQEDEIGEQIEFTGNELADIIAFVHSAEEQKKFSKADIPDNITKLMGHMGKEDEDEEQEKKKHE